MSSQENINKMADILDEAAMLYYDGTCDEEYENSGAFNYGKDKLHSNFYESLLKVTNYYIGEIEKLKGLEEEVAKQIDDKLDELTNLVNDNHMTREDIRRALLLLDIKGFKNLNFSLDLITPDALCVLMSELVKSIVSKKKNPTIFDPCMGIGNSLFYNACSTDKDINLIGMDSHELMARVAAMKANLLQVPLEIHFEDALSFVPSNIDCVTCDIPCYEYENENYTSSLYDAGVRYFPYLLIDHLLNIRNKTKFVYLIDNDFFNHEYAEEFRKSLSEKGNILALVALPENFFVDSLHSKSILILDNDIDKRVSQTGIYSLPPISKREEFLKVLNEIKKSIE